MIFPGIPFHSGNNSIIFGVGKGFPHKKMYNGYMENDLSREGLDRHSATDIHAVVKVLKSTYLQVKT